MSKITLGVTGTGSLIGQAVIKSINAASFKDELRVIGFDYFPQTVGSFWVHNHYLLPDFLKEEVDQNSWLDAVLMAIEKEQIQVLFVGVDFELPLFARFQESIKEKTGCTVMVSSPEVIAVGDDKYKTFVFLKENGFSHPQTFLPQEIDAATFAFPCFVKPRKGSRSRDAHIVSDAKQLSEYLVRIKEPLVQELVGEASCEYTCGVVCLGQKVSPVIVLRRDLRDGNTVTAYCEAKTPKDIQEYVRAVAQKLAPYGACNFQLRVDQEGIPKIFEINARHSGTTFMRSLFGFNEVEYILAYLLGKDLRPFALREGVVKRFYDELFIAA